MELILDGQQRDLPEDGTDAMALLAALSDELRAGGRALVSIRIDGETVNPAQVRETLEGASPDTVGRMELESVEVAQLVASSLNDLENLLPELPRVCHQLAEAFQSETPESGFEPFQEFALIWQTIKEREMMVASALDLDIDKLEVNGTPIAEMHRELNQFLDESVEALKSGDTVVLGDLLEYELAPRAESEQQIVAILREQAETRPQ